MGSLTRVKEIIQLGTQLDCQINNEFKEAMKANCNAVTEPLKRFIVKENKLLHTLLRVHVC